jgi:hypothetical protein
MRSPRDRFTFMALRVRSLIDHGTFQFGEHGDHLRHGSSVWTAHVKRFCDCHQLKALLVEVGDDVGSACDGAEESIQFRCDDENLAFLSRPQAICCPRDGRQVAYRR